MFKSYLKLVKTIVVLSFIMVVLSFGNNATAGLHSGAVCKAANLSQALSLGLGHSQIGASNNGTGNFFVVCPLDYSREDNGPLTILQIGVQFPAGGGDVACIGRGQSIFNGVYTVTTFTVSSALNDIVFGGNAITWNPSNGLTTNATLVCALGPGESIVFVNYR